MSSDKKLKTLTPALSLKEFKSVTLPILFLGKDLKLAGYSGGAASLFKLTKKDMGKKLEDITCGFGVKNLSSLLKNALKGKGKDNIEAASEKGVWYRIGIYPVYEKNMLNMCIISFINIDSGKKAEGILEVYKKDALMLNHLYQYRVTQRTRKLEQEITERKKIEEKIKENENLYFTILKNFPNGSVTLFDKNLRVIFTEGGAYRNESSRQRYKGKKINEIFPAKMAKEMERLAKEVFKGRIMSTEIEINNQYYAVSGVPVRDKKNKISSFVAFARVITHAKLNERLKQQAYQKLKEEMKERKSIEESLRILSGNLMEAQEAERLRLSRELHDGINQLLSAVKLKLHNSLDPEIKDTTKQITDAKEYIERAISEVRNISKNLRPIPLEDTGIFSALENLCNEFQERAGVIIKCNFCEFPQRVTPEIELCLYRIVQEAIHNVEKHAEAKTLHINLNVTGDKIILTIIDDGKGFDVESLSSKKFNALNKMGLIGIRERVELLKGTFEIRSMTGNGTELKIEIPVTYRKTDGR